VLSGGERQRVTIADFFVRDTRAYLVDEPIEAVELKIGKAFILVHDTAGRRVQ
jgi:ABC-type Mn2+/Zn2+ transport system ATPase subunit